MKKNLNCEESDNRKKKNLSKKNKRLLPSLIFFSSLFLLNISISFAWTGPPGDPPTCPVGAVGCSYLLNTGATAQTKTGGINLATTSGSVGIGTSSPGYKLDVSGTARFTGALTGLSAIFSSTVSVGTPTASTHAVTKAYVDTAITNSSSKWTTSGTNTYLTTTTNNVGIGTTSPEQKLDVAGNVRIVSGDLIFNHYSTNRNVIDIYGGDGNGIGIAFGGGGRTIVGSGESASVASTQLAGTTEQLNLVSDTNMVFTTNLQSGWATRVDSMYIAASGNVGIGQASPSYKLDVSGTGRFTGAVIVGTPTESGHATTKSYVDSSISNASSKWTVSGSNTYLTTTTNNVGIGTTSPTSKLHVAGKAQVTDGVATADTQNYASFGVTREASASSLAYIAMTKSATTVRAMGIDGSNNWVFGAPTITTQIISSPWMVISSSGSIGIGNTAPGYKLDVSGTGRFTGSVIVGEPTISTHAATKGYVDSAVAGTTQGTVTSVGTGSGLTGGPITSSGTISVDSTVIRTTGNQTLGGTKTFSSPVIVATPTGSTHATTKAYVDSAVSNAASKWSLDGSNIYRQYNNVGIGTTSPVAKLEVRQDMTSYDTSFTAPHLRLSTTNTVDYTGFVGVTYAGSTSNNYGWSVGALRSTNGLSSFIWKHHDNSVAGTEYMRITNTGNVGIGTINPIAKNHIVSSVTTSEILQVIGSGLTANAYTGIGFQGYIAGNAAIKSGILHQRILSYGVGSLMFAVNGVQDNSNISLSDVKMTINSSGDIGINDTTPSYKLDVNGTGRFTGTVSVATPTASNHATTKAYVDSMFSGSGPWTLSGSNVYVTNTANNVGIGNTSPTSKLHVTGDIASSSGYLKLSDGYGINWANGSGSIATTGSSSYSILFKTYNGSANTEKMRITGYGNVGIGNTDPVEKLDVNGAIRVSGVRENGGSAAGFLSYESGGILTLMGNGPDATTVGQIQLSVRETDGGNLKDVLRINSVGDVGINDTTPSYKLDVNGTGRFTGTLTGAAATFSSTVGVGTPTASTHATTKAYVDSAISGAASKWTTSGNNIYNNNSGNVGIGIASPSAKLNISEATGTVHGAAQGSFIIDHENSGGASSIVFRSKVNRGSDYGYIQYQDTDTVGGVGETARLIIGTSNDFNDHIILQPAGSVGIGQTSPSYKLDVSGTGRFTGTVVVGEPTASTHAVTKGYVDSAISGTTQGTVTSITAGSGLSGGTITTSGTIAVDSTVIRTTGNQTLGGTKTFSSAVVLSTAGTLTTHAVRADRSISTGSGLSGGGNLTANRTLTVDSTVIRTTGDQTLGGTKTFSSPVVVPTPTGSTHATTKAYVDSMFSGSGPWTLSGSNVYVTSTSNNVGIGTTSPQAKLDVAGNLNVSGIINGGADMAPNLIRNSYMNLLNGSLPAGYSGTGVTIEAVSAFTKGFEGCYRSSATAGCTAATPDDATGSNAYWYGSYNKGPRIQRGGLADGWHALNDGRILKVTGAGIASGSHSYVSLPFEQNALGNTWHFKAWVKIVKGSQVCFGSDAGYLGSANGVCVTKTVADQSSQGWYRFNGTTTTSQITRLDGLALSIGALPDVNGDVEVYVALPYVASLNTFGTNKETWIPSVTDNLSRSGLTLRPDTNNVGIGTSTPGYKLEVNGTGKFTSTVIVGTPTSSDHATTKAYVDSMFSGSGPWTLSGSNVYVTSTANNVGIGTSTPNRKLEVNGIINLTGLSDGYMFANRSDQGLFGNGNYSLYLQAPNDISINIDSNDNDTSSVFRINTGTVGLTGGTNLLTVLESGNIGIGIGSPSAKISIGVSSTTGITTDAISFASPTSGDLSKIQSYNAGSYYQDLIFQTSNGSSAPNLVTVMTIKGSSGNVGIGQTSPGYKLDVSGTGRFTGALTGTSATFSGTVGVATPTASTHATTKAYVDSAVSNAASKWVTSGTNIYNANTGYVGIGTSSPQDKLHVSGGSIIVEGSTYLKKYTSSWTGREIQNILTNGWLSAIGDYLLTKAAGNNDTPAAFLISNNLGLIIGKDVINGVPADSATAPFATNWARIGGTSWISGNLGIGQTAPSYKLDVSGTGRFTGTVSVATPTASNHATTKAYVDSMFSGSGPWTLSGSNVYVTNTSNNVGIGTTSPGNKLTVNGSMRIVTPTGAGLLAYDASSGGSYIFSLTRTSGVHTNDLNIGALNGFAISTGVSAVPSSSYDFYINSSGNVGIGTTSPIGKLEISGGNSGTTTPQLVLSGGTSGAVGDLYILDSKNVGTGIGYAAKAIGVNIQSQVTAENNLLQRTVNGGMTGAAAIYLGADDVNQGAFGVLSTPQGSVAGTVLTERFTVRGNGDVGINDTTPSYKLDVNGTGRFTGTLTGAAATFSSTVGVGTPTASTHATTKAYVDSAISSAASKWTTSGNNIYNNNSGNVGIGTISPGAKLDIAGTFLVNRDAVAYYYNLIHKDGGSSKTGTLKITLPKGWSSTMMKIKIEGFEYSGVARGNSWSVNVGGYNYLTTPAWYNYFAEINGAAKFSNVRLGYDGTRNVILLGTTTSTWSYSNIAVTEMMATYGSITGWDTGWSIDWITDETGITNIATPAIDLFRDSSGNIGINDTTPSYKLDVNGTGRFTGTVSIATPTASNHATTKAYVDSLVASNPSGTVTSITAGSGLSGGTITTSGTIAVDSTVIRTTGNQTLGGTKTFSSAVVLSTAGTLTTHAVRADRSISTGSGLSGGGNLTANRTLTVDSTVIRTTGDQTLGGIKTFSSPVVVPTPTGSTHATTKAYVDSMFSGSGPWTLSGSNVYVTNTSHNVGIGTTSPSQKLEINNNSLLSSYPLLLSNNYGTSTDVASVGIKFGRTNDQSWGAVIGSQQLSGSYSGGMLMFQTETSDALGLVTKMAIDKDGNVGIGTTGPGYKLDVRGDVSINANTSGAALSPIFTAGNTGKSYLHFPAISGSNDPGFIMHETSALTADNNKGVIHISPTDDNDNANDYVAIHGTNDPETIKLYTGGNIYTSGILQVAGTSNSYLMGNFGIGTTSPGYKLDVNGTGRFSGSLTGTSATFSGTVGVATPTASTHATTKAYVDGGFLKNTGDVTLTGNLNMATYKLTVGTIDPLFNINGKSYATYAPSMTGVKEESTGVIKMGEANCEEEGNSILCNYEIKFDEQKDGSDLWIFRKVTDFGDEWKNLEIILTPNFNGSVWYKKIPGENKILVSANINSLNNSDDFEISYRFTAARFDHEEWSNTPEGVNPEAGFIIK